MKAGLRKKHADRQLLIGRFFSRFYEPVRPWFRELVSTYKERGDFTVFPTYIADYYENPHDKEIALLSCLLINWDADVHRQVQSVREMLGKSPWEWFTNRLFVTMSTGGEQDKGLSGTRFRYWQVARFFDTIYQRWRKAFFPDGLEKCFPITSGRSSLEKFADDIFDGTYRREGFVFKATVIEYVLRASGGVGQSVWKSRRSGDRCPQGEILYRFLQIWINDFRKDCWDFNKTIRWFCFDKDEDFFYFWMAWTRLSRLRPRECSRFSSVFWKRYNERNVAPPSYWRMYLPTIEL